MFNHINYYQFEDCIICAGTGMIQVDPWSELPPNTYAEGELDQVVCPHCNGEGQIKIRIK